MNPQEVRDIERESVRDELAAESRRHQQYQQLMTRHPDCRDPEHPGCDLCWLGDASC